MTDTYTPANWSQGYGWGQGYPSQYGTAPNAMPSPSFTPPYGGVAASTVANGGVPPGSQAQEALQALAPSAQPYGPPGSMPAAPQPQQRFSPQQLQLLQYFLGGNKSQGGQQQMLMQMLMQKAGVGQQGTGIGGNMNNGFLQNLINQHLMANQVPDVPSP